MDLPELVTTGRAGLAPGPNRLLDRERDPAMGLDLVIDVVAAGERRTYRDPGAEQAVLVVEGAGALRLPASGAELRFARTSWVEEGPAVAHAPAGEAIELEAERECHVAVVGTANVERFAARLLAPAAVPTEHRGKGLLGDAAYRLVRCAFDHATAPAGAMLVLGEVVTLPGRWSSYPPHHHPQPEIYYYRFHPAHGYGHGECGERVYKLRQHDVLRITAGEDHGQCAAPGYHMYYLWVIRHLPGRPYTGFEYDPTHAALLERPSTAGQGEDR